MALGLWVAEFDLGEKLAREAETLAEQHTPVISRRSLDLHLPAFDDKFRFQP